MKRSPSLTSTYFGTDVVDMDVLSAMAGSLGLDWTTVLDGADAPKSSLSRLRHGAAGTKTSDRVLGVIIEMARSSGRSEEEIVTAAGAKVSRIGRKTGPIYPLTAQWRERVERRMHDMGLNRARLADALGVSRTAITDLLSNGKASSLVPEAERVLNLNEGEPVRAGSATLLAVFADLSEANRAKLIRLARHMLVDQQCDESES